MSIKNRNASMSDKTKAAQDRSHVEGHEGGPKESLPMGRREQMIAGEKHPVSDHNIKGNTNLRGKNLAYATRKVKN